MFCKIKSLLIFFYKNRVFNLCNLYLDFMSSFECVWLISTSFKTILFLAKQSDWFMIQQACPIFKMIEMIENKGLQTVQN